MLVPDVLVCSVGTEIFFESTGEPDKGWQEVLDRGWDRAGAIAAAEGIPELKPQVRILSAAYLSAECTHQIVNGSSRSQTFPYSSVPLRAFLCSCTETLRGADVDHGCEVCLCSSCACRCIR